MSLPEPPDDAADAIQLLSADHEQVRALFGEYQQLADDEAPTEDRVALSTQICFQLLIHAQIEEEILYPAAADALDEAAFIDEARAEHDSARETIVRLEATDPRSEDYDATVLLLAEIVDHHVEEEERYLFPRLHDSGLDLERLGSALSLRRQELFEEVLADLGEQIDE